MTRTQAWAATAVIVAVLSVGHSDWITGAGAQVDDVFDQLDVDPGAGFVFRLVGPCAGVWQSLTTGVCVHADHPGSSGGFSDGTETYDAQYRKAIATTGGRLPAYCAGTDAHPSWRVIYAYDRSTASRYAQLRSRLHDATERVDYWIWKTAKLTGGARHVRYVCGADGAIRFSVEELAGTNTQDFSGIVRALRGRGFNASDRKYLVYADVEVPKACGQAEAYPDDRASASNYNNRGNQYAVAYLRTPGCDRQYAMTAMHEIAHAMGAVQASAPNHQGRANPWHARDARDRLSYGTDLTYPRACAGSAFEKRYDCRSDDYFNTNPARGSYLERYWNVARNQFLRGSEQ